MKRTPDIWKWLPISSNQWKNTRDLKKTTEIKKYHRKSNKENGNVERKPEIWNSIVLSPYIYTGKCVEYLFSPESGKDTINLKRIPDIRKKHQICKIFTGNLKI